MTKIKRTGKFYVYILKCRDNSFYTGYTNDLSARLERHNQGLASKYTRSKLPVVIVWKKAYKSKGAAMSAEAKIKQLTRAQKVKLIYA